MVNWVYVKPGLWTGLDWTGMDWIGMNGKDWPG
jgi:hypothetical protein